MALRERLMMLQRLICILIGIFMLNCAQAQPLRLLKQGCIKQGDFLVEFPMHNYLDLIMVKVDIGGTEYDFMFDTGSDVSIISQDIITQMNLQVEKHCTIQDSKKRRKKTGLLAIPEIQLGGISFQSTAAAIEDMSSLNNVLSCYSIDGILGTNFIRLAYWQIDYQNNTIKLTNDPDKLLLSGNVIELDLQTGAMGSAKIEVNYNGIKDKVTFDTGSNGGIATTTKILRRLKANSNNFQHVEAHGDQSGGLYGIREGSTWHGYVNDVSVGGFELDNRIIKFESDAAKTIGNKFFKNFVVTIDWTGSKLFLDQIKPIEEFPITSYGFEFKPDYSSNGFKIGVVWNNSSNELPTLGSKVVQVNGENLDNLSKEEFCTYLQKDINQTFSDRIELTVLENGNPRTLSLSKTQILPEAINP